MKALYRLLTVTLLACVTSLSMVLPAYAHLMVAQHGALNITDDGIFMVLSLPVSAFEGMDDDSDGQISMIEFNNHRGMIVESVKQQVVLSDGQRDVAPKDILLAPVVALEVAGGQISQLVVMGRFTFSNSGSALLHIGLYGSQTVEQSLEITVTRFQDDQKNVLVLTPAAPAAVLFPGEA